MISKIKERFTEPSTYAGLAAVVYGAGELLKINEAEQVASALTKGAETLAATGNVSMSVMAVIAGFFAMILKEKGK